MSNTWNERLALYNKLVALCPEIERKGQTMPYTSANGYMFSLLNKAGEIGIRLSKEAQEKFMKDHDTTIYKSYGAVMRGYVLIPENLLAENLKLVAATLEEGFQHVLSLPPNPTTKKK